MFDKMKFAQIIKNISETYENQRELSEKSKINRTYLSQYMNMKLDDPPKPKILEKLANASHKITTYEELMNVCGYIEKSQKIYNFFMDKEDMKKELEKIKLTTKEKKFIELYIKKFSELIIDLKSEYSSLSDVPKSELKIRVKKIQKELNYNMFSFSAFGFIRLSKALSLILGMQEDDMSTDIELLGNFNIATEESPIININSEENISDSNTQFYMCPVYGKISAGQPNWAEDCLDGYLPIDPNLMNIVNPEECFFLKVNGESMNKIIKNGAYALIRKTDFVENGEIAAVLVNGFDATLKKFTKQGDVIVLEPLSNDSSITTQIYSKDTSIKVIGKYIGKMEMN